jgi:hypothetical protein
VNGPWIIQGEFGGDQASESSLRKPLETPAIAAVIVVDMAEMQGSCLNSAGSPRGFPCIGGGMRQRVRRYVSNP